jgi:beta-ketoacyl-acyl-carrier-protein synthase II
MMDRPRVVITGMGVVSPLGNTIEEFWQGLISGKSGIGPITQFDASDFPCQIAGEVKDFKPLDYMDRTEVRRTPRSTHLAVAAARMAIADASLPEVMPEPERSGVFFGTGVAGIERIMTAYHALETRGHARMNPFHLPSGIPNMPAAQIAMEFQCLGPNNTTTTACSAGTQAIGEGAEYIRRGAADIVLAGGAEAIVSELVIGAFSVMRALPFDYNKNPEAASRPFDQGRQGFVLSEGAAVVILESLEHAVGRGARIYAEVLGQASSSDGHHMIALNPDGLGPARAMRWALADSGIEPEDVDYINAHGTSTPLNDVTETKAVKMVFGESAYDIPISSTKSMTGHAMGATGALETVACTLAIVNNVIPPTINYTTPDPECDLNYVPNKAIQKEVNVALSNSFGLGGQNACIVLRGY